MKHIELTLKEFVIAILYRWKLVVAIALILAALFGAYSYWSVQGSFTQLEEEYQSRLATYEQNLMAKQASIAYNQDVIAATEKYNENSLLMQIDPYNKQVATLNFSVNLDPDTLEIPTANGGTLGIVDLRETLARKIARQYFILAESAPLSDIIMQATDQHYNDTALRELVQVNRRENGDEIIDNMGIITLRAFGTPQLDPLDTITALYQYLLGKQDLIADSTSPHTLSLLNQSSIVVVDTALAEKQIRQRTLLADAANQIETLQDEIETLRREKPAAPSKIRHLLTNAALGFVLGLLAGLVAAIFHYLLNFPLQAPEQLQQQTGLRLLGGVEKKGLPGLRRLSSRLAGNFLLAPAPEALGMMAANIKELIADNRRLFLTGSLSQQQLDNLARQLAAQEDLQGVELVSGISVNKSAQSIRELAQADAVVLVERLQTSRLKEVWQEKERVEQANKPVLGYVLI